MGDCLLGGFDGEFGEAEVEEFDLDASAGEPSDHEVAGFQVAVEDVSLVGGEEAFEGLFGEGEEIGFAEGRAGDEGFEGVTIEEFHDDKGTIGVGAEVEEADDVWGIEGGEGVALF